MKKNCWILLVGFSLLGCESGDTYYIENVVDAEDEGQVT